LEPKIPSNFQGRIGRGLAEPAQLDLEEMAKKKRTATDGPKYIGGVVGGR